MNWHRILILQRFSIFKHVLQDQSFYYSKQSNTSLVEEFLSHIYFFIKTCRIEIQFLNFR